MKIVYITLLLPLFLFGQQDWQLAKNQDGISIWIRNFENSPYKEYKAITYIDTTIDLILNELLDAPKYMVDCQSGVSHLIRMKSKNEYLFYARNKLPWPLRNRDVISKLTLNKHSDTAVNLQIEAAPQELPTQNNTLRIQELKGFWLLEKVGHKVKVTQQLYIDPEGNLPAFVTNSLLVKGPYKTFTELRNKVSS